MEDTLRVVFVTDFDEDTRRMVRILEESGYGVIPEWVKDRLELCARLEQDAYDLVVFDFTKSQPDEAAIDAVMKKRAAGLPVVAVMSDSEEQSSLKALYDSGFDCILQKELPFLGHAVRLLLRGSSAFNELARIEDKYRVAKERLTVTLESIGDGVITTDINGNIGFMNKTAEELTGWNQSEAQGCYFDTVFRIIDKKTGEVMESPFSRAMRKGSKSGLKNYSVLVSKDGNEYYVSASSAPIRDKSSDIIGLIIVFRDITKIKKIEHELDNEQKNLKAIFDAAPVGMLIIDENIEIERMNGSFMEMFDSDITENGSLQIGSAFNCIHHTSGRQDCGSGCACNDCQLRDLMEEIAASSKPLQGLEIKRDLLIDGKMSERWFRINSVPISINGSPHSMVVVDNVTEYRQLEIYLVRSRDFYLTLFENFPTMIWRAGTDKKCNYFNNNWLEFSGRTLEQEMGDGWAEGVHPEDIEMCVNTYSSSFDLHKAFEMEYRLKNRNGEYRWILDIGSPFYDIDGSFAGYIGCCFDITERKIADEVLKRYQLLSEKANDIILFSDTDGNILEANNAALSTYGYAREELLKMTVFDLRGTYDRSLARARLDQANTIGIFFESEHYRKDGSCFTVEVSSQGTDIGKNRVILSILRDVTERKRTNEELKRAKEAAEAASRAKSEFLANMSHEIRTPLNGVVGMIDLTLHRELNQEQRDNLNTAKECAGLLLKVINDILDFSKIEAGKLSIENIDFNVRDLLDQIVKAHSIRAREKGLDLKIRLHPDVPRILNSDPGRLRQVLGNLIGNAVKFTESGEIGLSVDLTADTGEYIELEFKVSDTGIGIAPDEMERLFKTFSQVDGSYTRKYGGTGLGLVISKQLVEMMGGVIWVDSEKGRGSTFHFTLKVMPGNRAGGIKKDVSPIKESGNPLRILLVEDERINQLITTRIIEAAGHSVATASNGKEALRILAENTFDIILMDIQMPEMDGIEATKAIRKSEELTGKHIPIIALTAYALQGDREKFLSAGMDDYISKPVHIPALLSILENADNLKPRGRTYGVNEGAELEMGRVSRQINEMQAALDRRDLFNVEHQAHAIKTVSSRLSITGLKNAAFKVELASRKGNLDEAIQYFKIMGREFQKYRDSTINSKMNTGERG